MAAALTSPLSPALSPAATAALAGKAANAAARQAPPRPRRAGEDFEAVFLNSMFQQMFAGVGKGPFSGGHGASIWRSFLTDEYSKSFAKAGGIGIAAAGAARAAGAAGGPMSAVAAQPQARPCPSGRQCGRGRGADQASAAR